MSGTNQPTPAPTAKVAAGGVAGAATLLIVFIAGQFGLDVPPEAASALTVLIGVAAAYIKKEK